MSNLYLTDPSGTDNWNLRVNNINSNTNTDLVVEGRGTGDVILKTNNVNRLTISDTGFQTFQGGMTYNNATNTLTATNFSGTTTNANNVATTLSSTNSSFYPTFVSTTSGNNPINVDTDLTYNPSTNSLNVVNINATNSYQKNGTTIVSMNYGTISFVVSGTTTPTSYNITMPAGCNCYNLISWTPVAAINNYLTIFDWSVGPWSGVLGTNQIRITAALGNGVHLEDFTIAFYWRI